jgi:CheY-like chemotaxis protein
MISQNKRKVMIVEDEAVTAMIMERLVQELGLDVCHVADTGRGAIDYAAKYSVDAILMDIKLNDDIDGITAALEINRGIPVIYHSAYIDDATLKRARETNPIAILEKPASETQIKSSVDKAVSRNKH